MSVCVGCCWLLSANTTPPNMAAATSQHEPARPDEYRLFTLTRMSTYVAGGHVGPSCRLVCPATRHGRHVGRRCWLVCRQSARIDRGRNRATAVNSNYPLSSITALRDRIFYQKNSKHACGCTCAGTRSLSLPYTYCALQPLCL